ncbi:hypothetical protein BCR36DRAFT_290498, partial [Piromyces finnis]
NQPFTLPSQQYPIRGASRVPPRPSLSRQRPMTPSTSPWPLNPGFPLVGQPNQLLMQQPFPFSPDVMNNPQQLMLLNQQRNNIAALYLQQMAQAAAAQNSPMIRPIMNYPSNSNLSSTSSNSPINKEPTLTKQNSHSSLANSPESNTNTSSTATSIASTTATTSTPAQSSTLTTTLTTTTTTSSTTSAPAAIANPATPIAAAGVSTPLAAQNLLAAAAVANAVKPPTNPVDAVLAASNTVTAGNIASPVFQQKLLPITQVNNKYFHYIYIYKFYFIV